MPKQNIFKRSLSILSQTAGGWVRDNAMRLSASLSLYTILSLAPLLVNHIQTRGAVCCGTRTTPRNKSPDSWSASWDHKPPTRSGPSSRAAAKPGHGVLAATISSGVLVFSATGVFAELQNAMNSSGRSSKTKPGNHGIYSQPALVGGMGFGIASFFWCQCSSARFWPP